MRIMVAAVAVMVAALAVHVQAEASPKITQVWEDGSFEVTVGHFTRYACVPHMGCDDTD